LAANSVFCSVAGDFEMANDANAIKAGDVVQLKSGGPAMTVESTTSLSGSGVKCVWFDGAELKLGHFAPTSLKACAPRTEVEGS
jgi:uncharacterized protein YodC (DUF2158 family)